ncbi:YciI family protein [Primorskyibacter flagellatus]|uniref:Uncharacterized conserved protein n=1 Tax=Primorskyibacter flagellatus TaxID=1387277 RepID=A0A1W2D7D9_9RHOB|nr:Uncharacterized conserved protein [Primorskyibacter flagellatus]
MISLDALDEDRTRLVLPHEWLEPALSAACRVPVAQALQSIHPGPRANYLKEGNFMPNFIFAFHGGKMPETEEEGAAAMAAWEEWYKDMGDAVADPGNPVGMSMTVSSGSVDDNGGSNPLSGYTIVTADSPEAACEMAKGCPMLKDGGTVEVAPIIEM